MDILEKWKQIKQTEIFDEVFTIEYDMLIIDMGQVDGLIVGYDFDRMQLNIIEGQQSFVFDFTIEENRIKIATDEQLEQDAVNDIFEIAYRNIVKQQEIVNE